MNNPAGWALRGHLLDLVAQPALEDAASPAVRHRPGHWLLIGDDGRIAGVQPEPPPPPWRRVDHGERLILPGFVDAHVHSAQVDVLGSWGAALLPWLERHTFPAEQRFADPAHAAAQTALFLDALLAAGTTAACVFPTVHAHAAEALFDAARARGMAVVAGQLLMDRHAPAALCAALPQAERDSLALMARWHGRGRARYAVTPRFAPTSSDAQLALAGRLLARQPGLALQTHLAEQRDEARWVRELFPAARSYLDVYQAHGLLGRHSLLAHAIWLDDEDRRVLRWRGASAVHCPSSNLALGSGLFDWRAAEAAGVPVLLGSDIGAGTSVSLRATMLDAVKVQALQGTRVTAWALLHAATRAPALALGLGGQLGALEPGAWADLTVWDWAGTPLAARRQQVARELHERVFAWLTLADPGELVATVVAGRVRHERLPGAALPG